VYSGDCGRAEDLDPLIRAGDTLLVEASFGLGPAPEGAEHLDAPAIVALARRTAPARVLLTHIQMGHDREATRERVAQGTDLPVELVEPGYRTVIA
jgi:ribonuclease BN (tRNA processing enzyme)